MPDSVTAEPLRSGVIGTGALGRHHVRILGEMPEAEFIGAYDERREVAQALVDDHGGRVFESPEALLKEIECLVLATPTTSHCELGLQALEAGCHVRVEKPLASDLEQADRMVAAAGEAGRVLGVGHVEFYNPAVQRLIELGTSPRFLEIQRLSSFSPRSLDIDVILDLMIHDLQIVQALCKGQPTDVRAVGIAVLSDRIDMADARLEFEGCVASVRASRVSDTRVRQLRSFSDRYYVSLDYQEQSLKGFQLMEGPSGDGAPPEPVQGHGMRRIVPMDFDIATAEPLRRELEHFLAACRGEDVPFVDGQAGRDALQLALQIADLV